MINELYEAISILERAASKDAVNINKRPIVSISVTPEVFDSLVMEHHKNQETYNSFLGKNVYTSSFKPSDSFFFEILGVRIKPERI